MPPSPGADVSRRLTAYGYSYLNAGTSSAITVDTIGGTTGTYVIECDSTACGSSNTALTWTNWVYEGMRRDQSAVWHRWITTSTIEVGGTGGAVYTDGRPLQGAGQGGHQPIAAHIEAERVAHARAKELLESALSPEQKHEMELYRYFTVYGSTTKRHYRVHVTRGRHGNIEELDEAGAVVRRLCCAPSSNMPDADAILGQKLYLEIAEEEFVRTANVTDVRTGVTMNGTRFIEGGGLLRRAA